MEGNSESPKRNVRTIVTRVIVVAVILVAGYFGFKKVMYELHHESTDNAQVEARLVPVLPRVSGYIKKLYVEDYATVKKDSLIAEIDDADLQLQLAEMKADEAQAETDVENANAAIVNAQASVESAKLNQAVVQTRKDKAQKDLDRDQGLFNANAITQKQLDDTKSAFDVATKQLATTQNDVNVAATHLAVLQAQLKKAQAQVDVRKAQIEEQNLKLSYTKIYAASDGKIGKRNVDMGQYVQAGSPLFTIVNNQDFWVVANFKETQLDHLKLNGEAAITLDAYPDLKLKGKITSFSDATGARFSLLPPDNATGNFVKVTQRVPVRIEIENAGQYIDTLRAGLSVYVSVPY